MPDRRSKPAAGWRAAWDALPAAVVVADAAGALVWCNRAATRALGDTGVFSTTGPPDPWTGADGSVWVWRSAPWGESGQRVWVGHDVTDRHAREVATTIRARHYRELLASRDDATVTFDAAIGTASATFAHEVGNPLNAMAMHTQLIERRLSRAGPIDSGVRPSLDALGTEIRRLSRLLEELRGLAKRSNPAALPQDLHALVRELLEEERPRLDAQGVRAVDQVDAGLRASLLDTQQIQRLLFCLVDNAIDAMPSGGTLTVRGRSVRDRIRIEVIDTGCGVPEGIDPFEPFVTTKRDGTGLGLSVARQIAAAHGGMLSFGPGPERGSIFVLELPGRGR